jgi:small-conductance mechanosensitive channel
MLSFTDTVRTILAENTLQDWLTALTIFTAGSVILYFARKIAVGRLARLAARTETTLAEAVVDVLGRTRFLILMLVAFWLGAHGLALPPQAMKFLNAALLVVVLFQVALWLNRIVGHLIRHFVRLEIEEESSQVATSTALTFVAKLILWTVVLLVALDNLSVDVNTLIASLGVGGIAVALAAQNILGDLFASLSIMFDKPFVVGDFIVVGDLPGTVEKIGLKTTRVRSLTGEQLIFSNNDLLSSRIKNFKRMRERRITFSIGVTYETPVEKVKRIPDMIREILGEEEEARLDRTHFKAYGDFALLFETVFWVTRPEFGVAMDIQQRINLALFERFEKEGIGFAYPTQTVHLARPQGEARVD